MGERWRTDASNPGQSGRSVLSDIESRLGRGQQIQGCHVEPVEPPRVRCDGTRYCEECGKEVCSYKDPYAKKVWCYAHDHLTPWTKNYIVGYTGDMKKKQPLALGKRGRKSEGMFGSTRDIMKGELSE